LEATSLSRRPVAAKLRALQRRRGAGFAYTAVHGNHAAPRASSRVRNLILIVLLGAAAAASWWWSQPAPVEAPRPRATGDQELGYYLRGARMLGTDESGRVAYKILADRLDERPGEDRLLLERVQIDYHPPDQMPWVITAGSGSATRDHSEIELADGVEIQSQPTDGRAPVHVTTAKLRFLPMTSLAETDQHVVMSVGSWHVEAKGLRTLLKADRMELESDVHGQFAP
jgi:LPS export ABC transporter protein LptC